MPSLPPAFMPPRVRTPRPEHKKVYCTRAWAAARAVVLQRDGWVCTMCGKELRGDDATVDHVHEIQQGGEWLPVAEGLRSMCRACNSRKGRANQLAK
jgi:5-methylcytosine-specific restriction endonuclease McrA